MIYIFVLFISSIYNGTSEMHVVNKKLKKLNKSDEIGKYIAVNVFFRKVNKI